MTYFWLGGESEELLLTDFVGYAQQPLSLAALYAQQAWRQMTTQPYWPGSLDQGLGRLGGF